MHVRYFLIFLLLMQLSVRGKAQQKVIDSLHEAFFKVEDDSTKYQMLNAFYTYFQEINRDSALYYAEQQIVLARKNNSPLLECFGLNIKAYQLTHLGRFGEALKIFLAAIKIEEDPITEKTIKWLPSNTTPLKTRLRILAATRANFGHLMKYTDNTEQCIHEYFEAKKLAEGIDNKAFLSVIYSNLGQMYLKNDQLDSALIFEQIAEKIANESGYKKYLGNAYHRMGTIYFRKGDIAIAKQYFHNAIVSGKEQNNFTIVIQAYFSLTKTYLQEKNLDSSLWYAKKTIDGLSSLGASIGSEINYGTGYENLYLAYDLRKEFDSAYKYQKLALIIKDSLYTKRLQSLSEFQSLNFSEKIRLQELEKEKVVYQSNVRTYGLLAGLSLFLVILILLYRNNRQKQKANKVLETALTNLKSTQSQLIQSEKMASLGELTAGIAHEIQNPLNFVNNFSEVNTELLSEMKEELNKGNIDEAKSIADDVISNEQKINHHGKRADAIVKGMLQHSRSSDGVKEPTDINALCDEYLRLAYHGLRAKDKSFNASMQTNFDPALGMVNVIPQDLGRVVLNLITNAFYAVTEKKKQSVEAYEPLVTVSTQQKAGKLLIIVKDNGMGIPPAIKEKIFQPFFTTKPTGQGTGLGLSMSYDIVTKGHQGELTVNSQSGEYTEFTIVLPL